MRASNRPHMMTPTDPWPEGTRFATVKCTQPVHLYPERHPVVVLPNGNVLIPFRGRMAPNMMRNLDADRARKIAR